MYLHLDVSHLLKAETEVTGHVNSFKASTRKSAVK